MSKVTREEEILEVLLCSAEEGKFAIALGCPGRKMVSWAGCGGVGGRETDRQREMGEVHVTSW